MVQLGVVEIGRCAAPLGHLAGGPQIDDRAKAERVEQVAVVACEPVEPVGAEHGAATDDGPVLGRQAAEVAEVVHLSERERSGDHRGHGRRRYRADPSTRWP